MLVMLWLLMHGYHGLTGDGQIYAFQAMARLHPNLATDLYLQNASQDRFTLFSPLYAWCIGLLGLESAARFLTLLCTLWLLAAVWALARVAAGRDGAWAAVALLLITSGYYGGSEVFRLLEPFLTARLPAEALIVTALFCQVRGMNWLGLALALAALLIHPLMALPGLLMVICLRLPPRMAVLGAISGVIATFVLAVAAVEVTALSHVLVIMDAPWIDVVRERSQFLFLQLWSIADWHINARPFVCLGFVAIALPDARIRKLCQAAALVGAAGMVVALIGSLIGPLAILVQGQAWRWVWITDLISVVLLPFAALRVARDAKCGVLCAVLAVLGWTLPGIGGTASFVFASLLWLTRTRVSAHIARYLRWVSVALGVAVGAWMLTKSWVILSPPAPPSGRAPMGMAHIREIMALEIPAVILCALIVWVLRIARAHWMPLLISSILAGLSILILPIALKQPRFLADSAEIQKFAEWSELIPPTSTVLIAPSRDVGAFVWFTLDRPNYLSLDQSAGVVFSRATALEVRRRSEVLLPLMDPNWKILTHSQSQSVNVGTNRAEPRPLTPNSLIQVCADPALGFVISPDKAGFGAVPHRDAGAFKDWELYDCRKVKSGGSIT
jgi:hypothetical protein